MEIRKYSITFASPKFGANFILTYLKAYANYTTTGKKR